MCYHPFWLGQYYDENSRVLRAPLLQLKYTLKHWKSNFSYYCLGKQFISLKIHCFFWETQTFSFFYHLCFHMKIPIS